MVGVSGGGAMAKKLAAIAAKVAGQPHVQVGFLANAKYEDGTPVAMIAAIQEYGAPKVGIPPRPFFRTMIAAHKDQWSPGLGGILAANGYDVRAALTGLGQVMEGQLRQAIVDVVAPPLSPVTLMLRQMRHQNPSLVVNASTVAEARARVAAGKSSSGVSTKPLIDSGVLLGSVDSEVIMP